MTGEGKKGKGSRGRKSEEGAAPVRFLLDNEELHHPVELAARCWVRRKG